MDSPRILMADDDHHVVIGLRFLLEDEGYELDSVATPEALMRKITAETYDLLLLDMNFRMDTTSGQEGLDLITQVRALDDLPIIMLTGWATVDLAVNALKRGANDFLQKPWNDDRLLHAIHSQIKAARQAQRLHCLQAENQLLKTADQAIDPELVAHSPNMKACLTQLFQLAQSEMNILLTGENGTGKSFLANYVHQRSARSQHSLIAVNMGAINEQLFESEMFGHEKGAFTDAKSSRIGRFELADGGTLFLDEVANIPLSQQAKLLRVLESSEFERVGSSKTRRANVRIISATNAKLPTLIQQGEFRQDLFYRLNTITIEIPSLQQRAEDIVPLARHFLTLAAQKYHRSTPALTDNAIHALRTYAWPGNIRELSHVMERALFTCPTDTVDSEHLHLNPRFKQQLTSPSVGGQSPAQKFSPDVKGETLSGHPLQTLEEIEREILIQRLEQFKGNASQTAKSLGLSRSGWYRRVEKFDL